METDVEESQLWQNFQSMADNLLSLTESLPAPLKHRAIDDLKKRLPFGDSFKPSLSSSLEDTTTPTPQKKRGRPLKKSRQDVDDKKSESLSTGKSTITKSADLVIRTRHQRHVEQYGEQGISQHGYRSPIVSLLKSRSRQTFLEKASGKPGPRHSRKEPSKKGRHLKKTAKKDLEGNRNLGNHHKSQDISQCTQGAAAADPEQSTVDSRSSPQTIEQPAEASHTDQHIANGSDPVGNNCTQGREERNLNNGGNTGSVDDSHLSTRGACLSQCDPDQPQSENDLNWSRPDSLQTSNEANTCPEAEWKPWECHPSQIVILKRVPSMVSSGEDIGELQAAKSLANEHADGQQVNKEENEQESGCDKGSTTGESCYHFKNDGRTSQQEDSDVPVIVQKGRRGRKQKVTADYKCPECPRMLRSRDVLREHLKSHRSHYKCETCGRKFVFKFKYEAHREVHKSGNFHKCPHCANMVRGLDRLEEHINQRHPGLEIPEACIQNANQNVMCTSEGASRLEMAPLCHTDSVDQIPTAVMPAEEGQNDVKSADGELTAINKRRGHINTTDRSTGTHHKMNHVCYECKQVFRSSKKLQLHQKAAHSRMASPCYICSRRFLYRASYDEHVDDHKKGLLKQCPSERCNFYYKTEKELQRHNARLHSKNAPRPHVCKICSRSFWEARYLKQHMQNHDKSKMYVCETCNFVSYSLMSLRRHLVNHHEMKLAHVCDLCGAKLCSKNTLHDHIKRHLNQKTVVCEICSKAFINRSQLAMHMRIHKNPRYSCSICGKKSRTGNKLISHMLIHTKEKPYACLVEYCSYRCRVKSNLYKHMERVHKVQHPDKYKNYRYVEQLNNCAVEVVENSEAQPASVAESGSVMVTDVLYMCAFSECSYQAPTQEDVAKHQLHEHAMLANPEGTDTLLNDESALGLSELPADGALGCGVDVPETFESITIPVPVEEISDQTEAAHTLAQLQTAAVMKDDIEQVLQQPGGESPDLNNIKKEARALEAGHLPVLDISQEDIKDEDSKPVPYPKLDEVLSVEDASCTQVEGLKDDDYMLAGSVESLTGDAEVGSDAGRTVYIVRVENEDGGSTNMANYLELFAKSNVINLEPGTILVNEQGSVVSVIK